jgi:hypothetical protein
MGLTELIEFLEAEKLGLLAGAAEVRDLYRSLAESLRTLPLALRNSFAPESALLGALDPQARKISFSKPSLRSSEGEAQDNTRWLASLLNNLEVVREHLLATPQALQLADIADIRRVHADMRKFLEELYLQNSGWMLRDPNAEAAALARQKRKDVEELLSQRLDPFVERMEQLKLDEYSLRLRREIAGLFSSLESYQSAPQSGEALIREKCSRLGLSYDPELTRGVLQELAVSDQTLEARVRAKYARTPQEAAAAKTRGLRQKYLRVLYRYLDRLREVSRLLPILETVYEVYQPRPPLLERLTRFFALLAGRQLKSPRRDVEYSYIIGREAIEHRRASLESLIVEVNQLEKALLRVKSSLATARAAKTLKNLSPARLRAAIDSTRASLRRILDDGTGLVQWLGKQGNRDRLSRLPESSQRELGIFLETIHSTLIINSERLEEIDRRHPGQTPSE